MEEFREGLASLRSLVSGAARLRLERGFSSKSPSSPYIKKAPCFRMGLFLYMAVREGFEPSMPFDIHTFQACSFGHSDTSPKLIVAYLAEYFASSPSARLRARRRFALLISNIAPDQRARTLQKGGGRCKFISEIFPPVALSLAVTRRSSLRRNLRPPALARLSAASAGCPCR